LTEKRGDDLVVVDDWVPIVHPIGRIPCGSLLLSIVFNGAGSESSGSAEPLTLIRIRDEILELKHDATQTLPPRLEEEWTQVDEMELQPPPGAEAALPAFLDGEEEPNERADGYRIDEVTVWPDSDDEFLFESEKATVKTFFDPLLLDCPVTLQSRYVQYSDYF
jgi:hypothetical protein